MNKVSVFNINCGYKTGDVQLDKLHMISIWFSLQPDTTARGKITAKNTTYHKTEYECALLLYNNNTYNMWEIKFERNYIINGLQPLYFALK